MMEMAVPGFKLKFSECVFRNGGRVPVYDIRNDQDRGGNAHLRCLPRTNLSPRNQSGRCLGHLPLGRMPLAYLQRAEEASPASPRLLSAMTLGRRR